MARVTHFQVLFIILEKDVGLDDGIDEYEHIFTLYQIILHGVRGFGTTETFTFGKMHYIYTLHYWRENAFSSYTQNYCDNMDSAVYILYHVMKSGFDHDKCAL